VMSLTLKIPNCMTHSWCLGRGFPTLPGTATLNAFDCATISDSNNFGYGGGHSGWKPSAPM
jgi:hypothetical protein